MDQLLPIDELHMRRALELAELGAGYVEPNPMVGCVIAQGGTVIGEGWHQRFGDAHAEVNALRHAGDKARGATAYVTLEPCSHHGKTPPCSQALIEAGIARVIIAMADPFPQVAGNGIQQLQEAGIDVSVGLLEAEARQLNAPYLKLLSTGRPWVIAKWAMTLDGRIASHAGSSQWISGKASRAVVHKLRGRVDAVIVGRGTAEADDPQLTARMSDATPARSATRVVFDADAALSPESKLVKSAADIPVIIVASVDASREHVERLESSGCEVLRIKSSSRAQQIKVFLNELGARRMTNVLIEGGGQLLGSFFDAGQVDEVHAFIAPKLIGGDAALSPILGLGIADMHDAIQLQHRHIEQLGEDVYIRGRIRDL